MKPETAQSPTECPRTEIAAYIDGELDPRAELSLELHLAGCPVCAAELNEQKKLLCALDFALDKEEEIELPENFTKIVVANAESNVRGLRCPRERNRALTVCAALLLIVFIGLGAETSKTFAAASVLTEQFFVVGGFLVHFVRDVTIATTVIFRSFCLQYVFKSSTAIFGLGACFVFSLLIFSRLLLRRSRF
ncbi:MAG TPA: zf-HC2 domain-containing protein [Pyrinomonadaceae bacterium]|jgi:anti-sigma factor RsiW